MKMKTGLISVCLVILFLTAPGGNGGFLTAGEISGKGLRVDVYGGYSLLDPTELNRRAEYDGLREDFFTVDRYNAYSTRYGDAIMSYSGGKDGEYKKIKRALPVGLRIRYSLSSGVSLSLGVKYFSAREESQVSYRYDVRSLSPDSVQFYDEFAEVGENDPYMLSVKGVAPMIGIHYEAPLGGRLAFEGYAAVGPLFASCEYSRRKSSSITDIYGYWDQVVTTTSMEGKGTGLVVDAGLRLNLRVMKRVDLFIEGGYSFQKVGKISGPGAYERVYNDSNSEGYTESFSWDERWGTAEENLVRDWGELNYWYPSNDPTKRGARDFKLDLSGLQARIGISFYL